MCTVTYLCMYNCIHVYMYQWRSIRFKSTCAWPGTWNNAMQWKDILLKDLNCNILSPTPPYILDSDQKKGKCRFFFQEPQSSDFPLGWPQFCMDLVMGKLLRRIPMQWWFGKSRSCDKNTFTTRSTAQCALHKSPMKHKVDIKQIAQWTAQVSRDRVFVQFEMHKFVQLGVNCTRTHRSRELCSGADNMMSTLCTW